MMNLHKKMPLPGSNQKSRVAPSFYAQWRILVMALVTIAGMVSYDLVGRHSRIDERERERLLSTVAIAEKNILYLLNSTNKALESIRDDLPVLSAAGKGLLNRRLKAFCDAMPAIHTLRVTDAKGVVLAANRKEILGMDFSAREYFTRPRQSLDTSMLYISPPVKTVPGVWEMNLTKVILTSRGEFAGIVTATLDPEYFNFMLSSMLYASDMRSMVVHGGGVEFLMVPELEGQAGKDLSSQSSFFSRHVKSGKLSNVMTGIAYATGEERITALYTIRPASVPTDSFLVVTFSRAPSAIYAEWRQHAILTLSLLMMLVLLSVTGLYWYQRRQRIFNSQREEAARTLLESEEQYREVVEGTDNLVASVNGAGEFIYVNPVAERIFGLPAERLLGMSAFEFVHPEERRAIRAWYADVSWRHSLRASIENRQINVTNGQVFNMLWTFRFFYGSDGGVVKINGIAHDITALKLAERELKLAQFSLERASIGILRINKDAQILSVNDRFCKNGGYTREELCTMNILDINPTFSPEGWKQHVKNFIGVSVPKSFETMHRRNDGTVFPVEVTVNYLDFQGAESFIVFVRNLTEQKEAEAEREKLQSQLHQAQKMEAVGQLAGGVAHDFNNILQAIIGYASLMKLKVKEDTHLSFYVDQILSSAVRSANLTRQLLVFSRKQLIEMKAVDINDLIVDVDKLLRRLIGEDIELRTRMTDHALRVMADKGQIEQVLLNLATNARDAMPNGGLLTIETEECNVDENQVAEGLFENPGRYARITVSDTGIGIAEEIKKKIFEPFYTTKEVGKGTGLGLAIVYGIIKQHGGEVRVDSEPGKGTTFGIYLPLGQMERSDDDDEGELSSPEGGTETILLVEDDEEVRAVVKLALEDAGYRVIEAVDGDDAVKKFAENKETIQLLLTDVIMPKKSGKQVHEEIKALHPAIKTLFISGYTSDIIQQKAILEEGWNFIAKPVTPQKLLKKIRTVLAGDL